MNRPILARALPFAVFMGFIALDGWLTAAAPSIGIDPRWLYAVRIAVVVALLSWFARRYVELKSARGVPAAEWSIAVVLGAVVFVLWINLDVPLLSFGQSSGFDPRTGAQFDWPLALIRLAGAALVVPVMEELFWRSFVMRWIQKPAFLEVDPRAMGLKALAISSILFALEHHLWFAGLLAGLAYGWLYIRASNLWVPIAAHATTNLLLGAWVLYTGAWQFW